MNNTSGPRVEASPRSKIRGTFGLPVDYQDELTTVAARSMLIRQADISRNKRKVIDKLAAQLILKII